MTKRTVALVVAAAGLALAAQPALAQGRRGGGRSGGGHPSAGRSSGGHPGGGHSGGGYAVPRGSGGGGYVPRGAAEARHPSGGSGHYGYGRYPTYGHGGYYGRGGYYGGYYPRYGYYPYYGGYYGSSFGLYLGFGGPYGYGSIGWGWPYSYGWGDAYPSTTNVYVTPSEGSSYEGDRYQRDDARGAGDYDPNTGRVRLEVRPDDATVYVDDEFWGSARESRFIALRAGPHSIELVRPGFTVTRREVDVARGETRDVFVELQRP